MQRPTSFPMGHSTIDQVANRYRVPLVPQNAPKALPEIMMVMFIKSSYTNAVLLVTPNEKRHACLLSSASGRPRRIKLG
jgi:hypothetical protein